jgi:hypothetical protein
VQDSSRRPDSTVPWHRLGLDPFVYDRRKRTFSSLARGKHGLMASLPRGRLVAAYDYRGPPTGAWPSSGSIPIVVDGTAQLLLAPQVTLRGLDRDVTEQNWKFAAG